MMRCRPLVWACPLALIALGVPLTANGETDPDSRFVDLGDGTIKDRETPLLWLKNANCLGKAVTKFEGYYLELDWLRVDYVRPGEPGYIENHPRDRDVQQILRLRCGLSHDAMHGRWRLPTKLEWENVVDAECEWEPKLKGTGVEVPGPGDDYDPAYCFTDDDPWAEGVVSGKYWTYTPATAGSEYRNYWVMDLSTASSSQLLGWAAGSVETTPPKSAGRAHVWLVKDPSDPSPYRNDDHTCPQAVPVGNAAGPE